jgi:activating signal cointegrator complex subunit 1
MDILKPQIIKIGTRHYRQNPYISNENTDNQQNEPYQEETSDMFFVEQSTTTSKLASCKLNDEYNDEACCIEDLSDINLTKDGLFLFTLDVSDSYFGIIIGRNGENKMRLERETSTKIKIPPRNKGQYITIEGKSKSSVASCRNRLSIIISTTRLKTPSTHFLSIPFTFENFKMKQTEFKEKVMKACASDRGMDATIFQSEDKLHLTICTLSLLGEPDIDQAYNLLEDCRKTFMKELLVNSKSLDVHIKGLEYMNDDPSQADVIYAKVCQAQASPNSLDLLQQIADQLMNKFVEAGLSKKQYDRVKLHVTVINSLMRKENKSMEDQNKERVSFDARNVLKQFGDFDFGVYTLREIHLSIRHTTNTNTGYYDFVSKVNF